MFEKLKVESTATQAVKIKKLAKWVYKELGQTAKFKVEVTFVDETEIRRLNREFRNKDAVTDVLSFPTLDGVRNTVINAEDFPYDIENGRIMLGSIAICTARAKEQAAEYGHSEEREFTYLVLHGLLHLFGYDHMTEEDKAEMRAIEKRVCADMNLKEDN